MKILRFLAAIGASSLILTIAIGFGVVAVTEPEPTAAMTILFLLVATANLVLFNHVLLTDSAAAAGPQQTTNAATTLPAVGAGEPTPPGDPASASVPPFPPNIVTKGYGETARRDDAVLWLRTPNPRGDA